MDESQVKEIEEREAKRGEKTISLNVRLWTDGIAEKDGMIVPKHAVAAGEVQIRKNESHSIKPTGKPVIFNTPMQLLKAIEELLIRERITLHLSSTMRGYVSKE